MKRRMWEDFTNPKLRTSALLLAFLAAGLIITNALSPAFRSPLNVQSILEQIVPISFVGIGQTCALIIGSVDLSVGSLVSAISAIAVKVIPPQSATINDVLFWLALAISLSIVVGLLNGLLINILEAPPLVITIAVGFLVQGLTFSLIQRPTGYIPRSIFGILAHNVGDLFPISICWLFMIATLIHLTLMFTRFGLYLYAVGNNKKAAQVSGINVKKMIIKAHMLTSLLAGIGGIFLTIRLGSGNPTGGAPYTLDSVIVALLGGATFAGGEGNLWNSIIGCCIFVVLDNALKMLQISPFIQYVVKGALFLIAVLIHTSKQRGRVPGT